MKKQITKKEANKSSTFLFIILILLITLGLFIYFKPKSPTGFVIGPDGEEYNLSQNGVVCDGDWTFNLSECINGTQTITWTNTTTSLNCTSPIIENQTCAVCGNSLVELGEACDGNMQNCTTTDGYAGTQNCISNCSWDICITSEFCGDNVTKGNEECDGTNLTNTCVSLGFDSGTLTCNSDCTFNEDECCAENWGCDTWSECVNGQQTRTCTDVSGCGTTNNKPAESQQCTAEEETEEITEETSEVQVPVTTQTIQTEQPTCTPNWQCGEWSECINETQTRTCNDVNNCGIEEGKPALSQFCVMPETCFDGIKNQDEKGIDCGGVCEERCPFFTIIGSAVKDLPDRGKEFFKEKVFVNKTRTFLIGGISAILIIGFIMYKFFLKKKFSLRKQDNLLNKETEEQKTKDIEGSTEEAGEVDKFLNP